jgi:hypothetical protein
VSSMGVFPKFSLVTTLKFKVLNNFKILKMVCLKFVIKFASTLKIYIIYTVTMVKLVKLIKLVFGSLLVYSMHLVGIAGCFLPLCSWLHLLFLYILC